MAKVHIESVRELVEKAGEIRKKLALGTRRIGNVHIGGPMSATDAAVAIYYKYMDFDPENLDNSNRNQFILSKGHNGILLYTIFCDMGIYDWDLLLDTYNTVGHPFGPHPNRKYVKGIEVSTGSLGHGLSWCCGIAHANRNRNIRARIFCMLGDGEMEEGSNWEAILYASSKKLDNIVAVVDFNHCSAAFETNENVKWGDKGGPEGLADCYRAFGWNAVVVDGSKMADIDKVLSELPEVTLSGKPNCIICNTQKGQGVKFMEERPSAWHIGGFSDETLEETIELIEKYTQERLAEVE
ncbi:MAG: 1-deoxy-D-xylulose-5-phosphate synthase N-terminal domain-containing protein [Bacilli bacterium]|nr:1-deoxy-D-xylulose-5-phosphate synthase N-terminal domain-containing protein [Bacilli bacterium]